VASIESSSLAAENMPHRREYPPPPDGIPERRREFRREDDTETHEIVEHAIEDAPIVRKLLSNAKVALTIGSLCTLLGGVTGALGYKIVGPHDENIEMRARFGAEVDSNRRMVMRVSDRTEALFTLISQMKNTVDRIEFIQCLQLRRSDPDLRPDGCDVSASGAQRLRKP